MLRSFVSFLGNSQLEAELRESEMSGEAVWLQLRRRFKLVDGGIDVAGQGLRDPQKDTGAREVRRDLHGSGERRNGFCGLSRLEMYQPLLKGLPGLYRQCGGWRDLQGQRKFQEFAF